MVDSLRRRISILASAVVLGLGAAAVSADALRDAVAAPHRTPEFVERDRYRNPEQTLRFFDVQPEHDVVEISPGVGWYTEILAPYVEGHFYAAHFPENSGVEYFDRIRQSFEERVAQKPDIFEDMELVVFDPNTGELQLDDNSVDRVLVFRSVHSWLRSDSEKEALASFFRVLRPGGFLGIVQHRSRQLIERDQMVETGYLTEDAVIAMAHAAGFEFVAASEANANFRDSANHPEGVWTLPPTLRLGDRGRDRYLAIGESDRMTLKFRKPAAAAE